MSSQSVCSVLVLAPGGSYHVLIPIVWHCFFGHCLSRLSVLSCFSGCCRPSISVCAVCRAVQLSPDLHAFPRLFYPCDRLHSSSVAHAACLSSRSHVCSAEVLYAHCVSLFCSFLIQITVCPARRPVLLIMALSAVRQLYFSLLILPVLPVVSVYSP